MNIQPALILFILHYFYFTFLQAEPLVKLSQGLLNGTIFITRNGRNISTFLGIPYAQPPVGDLRFSNPVPGKSWDGIRLANKEANVCAQLFYENVDGDEDCLYLNVYTPILEFNSTMVNRKLLPVMVWIHGGGFYVGSSSPTYYGPEYLLDKDIILVSMNYRLGIFGFLTTGDSVAPGNFGMKDQVLALKWVQKNIKDFGGDPNRVTIFGGSAGGASVNLHALSNATNGLFHQYIIQSGSALSPWVYRNKRDFKPYINQVARKVGCLLENPEDLVKCLREISVEELLKAIVYTHSEFPILYWVPTDESESEEAFLTDSPQNLISQNKMKDHPFMSGTVVDEGLLVTLRFYANKTKPTKHLVEKNINSTSNYYLKQNNVSKFKKTVEDYYFNETIYSLPEDQLLNNYTKFISDSGFLYPQVALVEKMAEVTRNPFYFYSFGYFSINMSSTFLKLNIKENIGVTHGEELSYLFPQLTDKEKTITGKDEKILNLMIDLWTSFAINGQPTSDQLEEPNFWLPYKETKSFLQIGSIKNNTDPFVTLEQDYFRDRMFYWKKHFPVL